MPLSTARRNEIIGLIHREVKPALGCTEPIAVALAVAKASELMDNIKPGLKDCIEKVTVHVSPNILKNGMGVGIPGTGMIGLHIAAALGAVCGRSEAGLEVLKDVCPEAVSKARAMVESKKIDIDVIENGHILFVKATVEACGHTVSSEVEDSHDHIVEANVDGKVLFHEECSAQDEAQGDCGITVKEICQFAEEASFEEIAFILDDRKLNDALAQEGLKGNYGLMVGKSISECEPVYGNSFLSYAMSLTAAASDARMAGCTMPAMSNSGSGNQGITVSMPVVAYGYRYKVDDERLARALIIANLTAIHIKRYLGRLSALCGCVVASSGAACGITYLEGGGYEQVCATIKNMLGNITGMVCDGAKIGCALKVASGVACAIQSSVLALQGNCVTEHDGIIECDIEQTIRNLGRIGSDGMRSTDRVILDIMTCK